MHHDGNVLSRPEGTAGREEKQLGIVVENPVVSAER